MKKIAITVDWNERKRQNKYHLRLGNGTIYEFQSKRIGQDFVNKTNKFLSEKWYNLSTLYSQTITEYYSVQGYFHNSTSKNGFMFLETKLRERLHEIDNTLNLTLSRSKTLNGNYTAFSNLFHISHEIMACVLDIKKIHNHKSNAQQLTYCNFIIKQVSNVKSEIEQWGLDMCTEIFEITKTIRITEQSPLKVVKGI